MEAGARKRVPIVSLGPQELLDLIPLILGAKMNERLTGPPPQQQKFRNDMNVPILIWVEPWAEGYEVAPGREILLSFGLEADQPHAQIDLSASKGGEPCLTIWVSQSIEPTASIDGIAVAPTS